MTGLRGGSVEENKKDLGHSGRARARCGHVQTKTKETRPWTTGALQSAMITLDCLVHTVIVQPGWLAPGG